MPTQLTRLFREFFDSEKSSGIVLLACTVLSMGLANSPLGQPYLDFWHMKLGADIGEVHLYYGLEHWVNDGLMTIFFLLIGLEIERELYMGELSDRKRATLPVVAAIGGMITPALIYFIFNFGRETQHGFGIPMATDIAFALGALSLLGRRVPMTLKVFLTALAIIDDLGAIVVISIFYVSDFKPAYLLLSLAIFGVLLVFNRMGVRRLAFYLLPGVVMWYAMLQSGVHATLSGVLLAFAIPFGKGDETSPSYRLQHWLHKPVAYLIMPVFALLNTGIPLPFNWLSQLSSTNSLGILCGLIIGKPVGIVTASFAAIKLGLAELPNRVKWRHLVGVGCLGGIGFTMSIFITLLAFDDPLLVQNSKIAVLLASLIAGTIGVAALSLIASRAAATDEVDFSSDAEPGAQQV